MQKFCFHLILSETIFSWDFKHKSESWWFQKKKKKTLLSYDSLHKQSIPVILRKKSNIDFSVILDTNYGSFTIYQDKTPHLNKYEENLSCLVKWK